MNSSSLFFQNSKNGQIVQCQNNQVDPAKLLSPEERPQYNALIDSISNDVQRARRHCGISEFVKHITLVHRFVKQGNHNDSLRGIVCGIEFGRGFILVNTDRLKKVLYRSKSCMNGCFQRLGYDVMRPSHDLVCLFTRLLPNVNPEFFAIRQWCVRLVTDQCTLCFLSNMPESIASNFEVHRIPTQRQNMLNNLNMSLKLNNNTNNNKNEVVVENPIEIPTPNKAVVMPQKFQCFEQVEKLKKTTPQKMESPPMTLFDKDKNSFPYHFIFDIRSLLNH